MLHKVVSYHLINRYCKSFIVGRDNLNSLSQTALAQSCVASIDARHRPRRCHRHDRGRYQTRHTAVPDCLGGRDWWVLHDLLAPRHTQSPVRAHVICVFGKEKLLYPPVVSTRRGPPHAGEKSTHRSPCVASLKPKDHL
jgi:hypothetical protein